MPDMPNVPDNFDELQEKFRSGWAKGKAAGASNTALKNTVMFMFNSFMEKQKQKAQEQVMKLENEKFALDKEKYNYAKSQSDKDQWKLMDTNGDGQMEWVNQGTQTIKNIDDGFKEPNGGDTAVTQPTPDALSANGQTAEQLQAGIDALGQSDQYGVLGVTDPTVLEKGPGYMQSEQSKQDMFAAQEAEAAKQQTLGESGALGYYGPKVSQWLQNNPIAVGSAVANPVGSAVMAPAVAAGQAAGSFFKEKFLPDAEKALFGEAGAMGRNKGK